MELQLYNALITNINNNLPEIKTVKLYNNQLERENVENPFLYPAIFIEFTDKQFNELSQGVQQINMIVNIRLCFASYKDEDTDILRLKQDVYKVINRFRNEYFSRLLRVSEEQNYDHNNIQQYIIGYKTTGKDFFDDIRPTINVTATASITGAIINITEL
jgi:hypothetical protein